MLLKATYRVGRSDKADDRGFLDKGNKLVAERGKDVLDRLRDDDAHHCHAVSQPDRAAALHLPAVDGQDAGTHNLGNVRAAVEAEYDRRHRHRRHPCDAEQGQQDVIEYKQLHDHRRARGTGRRRIRRSS